MFSAPIIIFYSFLVLLVFVIGVAPTGLWTRYGGKIAGAASRARHDRAAGQFARATAGTVFTPDIDYVPVGIGFAFDKAQSLLFVAGDHSGVPAEAVIPLAVFRAYGRGVVTGGFADDNYVELFPADSAAPKWRISCSEDVITAFAIERLLISLGLPKA